MKITTKLIQWVIASTSLLTGLAGPALAQNIMGSTSSYRTGDILGGETVNFRPQVGFLNYNDLSETSYTELVIGATADYNLLKIANPASLDTQRFMIGPETGLMFSHLSVSGSNLLYAPIDLKVGVTLFDRLRIAGHGGGNLIYRSTESAMRLTDGPVGNGGVITLLPNVGADVDYSFTSFATLSARPDITFSSGNNLIALTLALVVPIV